ncbi:MAG: hypothetical protein O2868_08030 [Proteobacteria bacterium]|nr:hypothetical protein [Pseudomonadota bacterium]
MRLTAIVVTCLLMVALTGVASSAEAPAAPGLDATVDPIEPATVADQPPSPQTATTAYWLGAEDAVVSGELEAVQVLDLGVDLTPGARILVDQSPRYPWQLQSVDPASANFIGMDSDTARFNIETVRRATTGLGPGAALVSVITVEQGELSAGSAIDIRYSRLKMPPDSLPIHFPVYLQTRSDGPLTPVDVQPLLPRPGPPEQIEVVAPSIVGPNERFPLRLLVIDQFGNPVARGTPSLDVVVDGVFSHRIDASDQAALVVPELTLAEPGHHFISVRSPGGGLVGRSNLILVSAGPTRIVWTELPPRQSTGGLDDMRDQTQLDQSLESLASGSGLTPPSLADGGRMTLLTDGERTLQVASADVPADFRRFNPRLPLFAEVISGPAVHEWFGQRLAEIGYRVSYSASRWSPEHGLRGKGRTAVVLLGDEHWWQALAAGRTYVASEGSPIIFFSLNEASPGSRIPNVQTREIRGEVHSEFGLHSVELVRNGSVIDRRRAPALDIAARQLVIRLRSSVEPLSYPFELPRAGREWIGYVRASGADISPRQRDRGGDEFNRVVPNPAETGRVDFISHTQGGSHSIALNIDPRSDDPTFELHIMAGLPDEASLEPAPATPAIRQVVSLSELQDGPFRKTFGAAGFTDEVEIELLDRAVISTFPFLFSDRQSTRAGDYYYVRVNGLDGQVAWTSPVYVGGFDVIDQ